MIGLVIALIGTLFLAMPMVALVVTSFSPGSTLQFATTTLSLDHYRDYFGSSHWMEVTFNSFAIALGTAVLTMILVTPVSFAYVRHRFFGREFLNQLILVPLVVPSIVSAVGLYSFLGSLHIAGTYLAMVIAHTALSVPITFLAICAALKGFDRTLERASLSCGAGPVRTFVHVVFPVLRPGLLVGALFAFLQSFNEAVVAIFLSGREAETLPKLMFESIRLEADPIIGAIATLLSGFVLLALVATWLLRRGATVHAV